MSRLDDFANDVVASGLVSRSTVDRERVGVEPDTVGDAAVSFAKKLIEAGLLTNYQAKKLLGGLTKGFFLGGHRILRRLGQGGMGKVYLGLSEPDGFKVAIKVLQPRLAAPGGQALKRFRREMDLSQRIKHPNLARTIDVGEENGVYFMIMEYVPGDSLYNVIRSNGPWRVPDAAKYFLLVTEGMEAAHTIGLIHRDIKPSNLMVTPEGGAKILDLGLARATADDDTPLTRLNSLVGTLDYASPEQLSDATKADARSDLYSLGCTLYFTLSGRAPFEGGDIVNKIYKHKMEDPPPLEKISRGVPSAFAAIVRKLMAKEPKDRYQSAAELRTDLTRWADPKVVRSILGAEAEEALAFRPPPPELDDEDLRSLSSDSDTLSTLRDLGEAEVAPAARRVQPVIARPAVVIPIAPRRESQRAFKQDNAWLVPFLIVVSVLGILAVVLIAALSR